MHIRRTAQFDKQYSKLYLTTQDKVDATIELFVSDPLNPALNNHRLARNLAGCRAINVDDDLRIVFREKGKYTEVLLLAVGSHTEVY